MFVHGEQEDTILASLLALMAPPQSPSRRHTADAPVRFVIRGSEKTPPLRPDRPALCLTQHIQI